MWDTEERSGPSEACITSRGRRTSGSGVESADGSWPSLDRVVAEWVSSCAGEAGRSSEVEKETFGEDPADSC